MIFNGVFGMKFNENSLSFNPYLPEDINNIELKNIAYKNTILTIIIKGKGKKIKTFVVDGKPQTDHSITSVMKRKHTVSITVQ